ncbi:DNA polymerase III subunit chi [Sphingomonas japonica]|uniref:DNA polymerase-3 subunit chi n=1 Tax=Sphingomonas japonica TaxID=511662 RepID=A0ABX0U4U1_9SPHN|nr:DNA polymerase III subunit chi [Sphingomonas japonica]NIJ25075.1 DNA polymerase-3 subunit chi [Sphingomonas japonica]
MKADFYHLTAQPLDRVLPVIAEKVLGSGERLLIVAGDQAQRSALDKLLWSYSAASFLPHGEAGGERDAEQPVLISGNPAAANAATNIAIVDGVWREEALSFARVFHFFGEDSIAAARAAWKSLADREGVDRRYWKQDEGGRWQQVA